MKDIAPVKPRLRSGFNFSGLTFATYFAPADFNETVNTLGQPLHAKQEPLKFDRGTDLHTQSNPLPMCHRPALLVRFTES